MAIPDVYTKEEEQMLADFNRDADELVGWAKAMPRRVATEESIKLFARAIDHRNPLWHDNSYTSNSRWAGITAPPMYLSCMKPGPGVLLKLPPSAGSVTEMTDWYIGEDWEFFRPVRVDDSFKVWWRRPQLRDVTEPDGKGPRKFNFLRHDIDYINQRDELVNTFRHYCGVVILPEKIERAEPKPDYVYTKEELEFIKRLAAEEEIRGARVRYWEDVKTGDELRPVVHGPTTLWDIITFFFGGQEFPFVPESEITRMGFLGFFLNEATGVSHADVEWHFSNTAAQIRGNPRAFLFGALSRQMMARLVTNWMGDHGFLRKFNWRHLTRTAVGDTLIGKGKVTNKRRKNGESLVDLSVWSENIRGNITEAATATVSLFSKENHPAWK